MNKEDCNNLDKCIEWVEEKFQTIKNNLLLDLNEYTHMPAKSKEELLVAFDEDHKIWLAKNEDKAVGELHFSMGGWLRNELGLWQETAASKFFNSIGIYHADDMSSIILTSYHRKANGKDINIDEQVKKYRDYWEKTDPNVNRGNM